MRSNASEATSVVAASPGHTYTAAGQPGDNGLLFIAWTPGGTVFSESTGGCGAPKAPAVKPSYNTRRDPHTALAIRPAVLPPSRTRCWSEEDSNCWSLSTLAPLALA